MRIGIDARLYNQTGVGRYIRNLISQLELIDNKNEYYIYLRNEDYGCYFPINSRWKKRKADVPWHTLQEQLIFPIILLKDNLDVVHFPYFNIPILYPKKYLLTVHDLIIDHYDTGRASTLPYFFYKAKRLGYRATMHKGIKKASMITAISETTKQEIMDHYHIASDKIKVTYDALDGHFRETINSNKPVNYYSFPYILYVGNAYPHKNLEFLMKVLRELRRKINIKLVLAGDDDYFFPKLKKYSATLGLTNNVIFFGKADDWRLYNLYKYSKLLVFPSLMEGFGLPNFEAVVSGKLCVVSDIPVFREVWGDKLIYFKSGDLDDCTDKLNFVLNLNNKNYNDKVLRAKRQINKYSWKKTAKDTLTIYEKIFRY